MFKAIKMQNTTFVKGISVILCLVLVFTIAPLADISNLLISASAANMPEYNPNYGSFTAKTVNGNTVLTATANYGCGFRGWYYKDGTEVAYTADFTVPSGKSAEDYTPVFYSYNLAVNGDFEAYADGTNMKTAVSAEEAWEGLTDSELKGLADWSSMKISSERAKNGTKSLKIGCQSNTAYHTFNGLEKNTQYTVSFWYNIDPSKAATDSEAAVENYLSFVSVASGDAEITTRANHSDASYLAKQRFGQTGGNCAEGQWKQSSITFYTDENTSVNLLVLYYSNNSSFLYIDDLCLTKEVFANPKYVNEDFANTASNNWSAYNSKYVTVETVNQRLHISSLWNFQCVQGVPMLLKKGYEYKLSFKLDLSKVTHKKVPLKDGNKYIYDADGNIQYTDQTNWINFNISNAKKTWGQSQFAENSETKAWESRMDQPNLVTDHSANGKTGTDVTITVTDTAGTTVFDRSSNWAAFGFHKDSVTELGLDTANLVITMTFVPDATGEYYLNTRLNSEGEYYIDDIKLTETYKNSFDRTEYIIDNAIKSLGTAMRTVGKQGMRYKTQLDKRLLSAEMYYGGRVIEYGTIAIKTEYLGDSELVLDGEYNFGGETYTAKKGVAYSFINKVDTVYAEGPDTIDFTGVLMNIHNKNWNDNYTARAYFKYVNATNGERGIFYVDPSEVAIYPLSKTIYSAKNADGSFSEDENVREYLYTKIISKFTDKVIKVNNASAPISSNFEGIRSTVYHATTFFPSNHGRTYSDEQAAIEMDRLKDTKVDNVRTRLASQWMWKEGTGWNWNSPKMCAVYKWAKMLQDRDISITLNAGWHLHDFIYFYDWNFNNNQHHYNTATGRSSIPEVNYLHGYTNTLEVIDDLYGEDEKANTIEAKGREIGLNLTDGEYAYFSRVAARYAEWIKQALVSLKAQGINNVKYVLPFTETGYVGYVDRTASEKVIDTTYSYDEWILMVMALNDELKTVGIRNDYKVVGPSQSNDAYQNREVQFVEYIYEKIRGTEYEDMIDIISMHQYTAPNTQAGYENTIYNPYACYSRAQENFEMYKQIKQNAGVMDKEFWCDEYSAYANDAKMHEGIGMQMTQFAAGLTAGINNGVNRFSTWQMFDCLWDDTATHGNAYLPDRTEWDEFIGGVHVCGTCPSLVKADGETCTIEGCACKNYTPYSSYVPRKTYYGINLIGKYMNNENADVYATEVIDDATRDNGGVYVSAIKNDDGMDVIMVVNTMPTVSSFDLQFENDDNVSFKRYTYNPDTIVPTKEAKSIESDKTITLEGAASFRDELPAGSFAIYVSTGIYRGDDVDMPVEPED